MRIIAGSAKRTILEVPRGNRVRPTGDRSRGMVFNLLAHNPEICKTGFVLVGAHVLDLCCGTGAYGLEALSRGAEKALFIDNHPESIACSRHNARRCQLSERCHFFQQDASRFTLQQRTFDLVFLDPPYQKNIATGIIQRLVEKSCLNPMAILVLEQSATTSDIEVRGLQTLLVKQESDRKFFFLRPVRVCIMNDA